MDWRKIVIIISVIAILLSLIFFAWLKYMSSSVKLSFDEMKNKKSLVVYYSRNDNIERIAYTIRGLTNADIYKLEPYKPYPKDEKDYIERLKNEKRSKNLVDLKLDVPKINDYEVVYVGTPIVLYSSAPVVKSFLKQNDFSNKIVMPFSSFGTKKVPKGLYNLKNYVPNSYYKNILLIKQGDENSISQEVKYWISNVKLNRWEKKDLNK